MKSVVLVVEDDDTLREMYALKLEMEGFSVLTASDGARGLELATSSKPDIILLDILMPRLTGIEFLTHYAPAQQKATVVVISNKSSPEEIIKVKQLGAADYLVKSQHTPDQIVDKIQAHLSRVVSLAYNKPHTKTHT